MKALITLIIFFSFGCNSKEDLYEKIIQLKDENYQLKNNCTCKNNNLKSISNADTGVSDASPDIIISPDFSSNPDIHLLDAVIKTPDYETPEEPIITHEFSSFRELRNHYRTKWNKKETIGIIISVDEKKFKLIGSEELPGGKGPCALVESEKHIQQDWVDAKVTCELLIKMTPKPDGNNFFQGQYINGWSPID
jgi:hypothetical protein